MITSTLFSALQQRFGKALSAVALFVLFTTGVSAATISGMAWMDTNGDGIRQNTENPMANVTVILETPTGTQLSLTTTSAQGMYSFANLPAGSWKVKFANPGGLWMSPANQGSNPTLDSDADPFGFTSTITLGATETASNIDAGFNQLGGCFTPVIAAASNVVCSPNGNSVTFSVTATGGTGPWGWDYPAGNIMMQPYGQAVTITRPVVNGVASITVFDHDNPFCEAIVTVNCPTTPPPPTGVLTFSCPANITVNAPNGATTANPTLTVPTGTSTCPVGSVTVTQISGPTSNFPLGTSTVCFQAADGCGNTQSCCYTVTVRPTGTLTFACAPNQTAFTDPGATTSNPTLTLPTATSTCPVGTVTLTQVSGPTSNFPVGVSTICYRAEDGCGNTASCCFTVTVKAPCDTKTLGPIIWDLLETSRDSRGRPVYKMRVTNNSSNPLQYVAFQVPDGVKAVDPLNNATYTAPSGRTYTVRNPNYSPFYSIRFSTTGTGLVNGQSDIFCYTLPRVVNPWYIQTVVRVAPKTFYKAYLDTWDCMPTNSVSTVVDQSNEIIGERTENEELIGGAVKIFPNPATDRVFVATGAVAGEEVRVRIIAVTGQVVAEQLVVGSEAQAINLPFGTAKGLYVIEIQRANGEVSAHKLSIN